MRIARAPRPALVALLLSGFLAACAAAPVSGDAPSRHAELAGTSWQLVEIQSMDDTTLTPDVGSKYTLAFGADGRFEARVDCNRAAGTWKATSAGQLEFGAVAATRAMCPPGSLHDRFLRDLGFARSYVTEAGRLHLSLMADGGIYVFEAD